MLLWLVKAYNLGLTLQVRSFGQQLLESVAYLHDLELIHTDLKPENILLVSVEHSKQSSSRLISPPRTMISVHRLHY